MQGEHNLKIKEKSKDPLLNNESLYIFLFDRVSFNDTLVLLF